MMRNRLVRKTFEMIEKLAKDDDKQVCQSFLYNVHSVFRATSSHKLTFFHLESFSYAD